MNSIKEGDKVLVVGGAGYIGGAVTDILTARNIPFSVYDNLLYENLYLKPVHLIHGDVRDERKLKEVIKDYSHVIWLAAIVGDGACQIKPDLTTEVNKNAVQWLADNFHGRIVFASTCSVYGQNNDELNENSPTNPLSLYAQTKVEAENILRNKNALIFRLGTVFGVGDAYSRLRMDLVTNYMTAKAFQEGKLQVYGGAQWRPLIHVRNVAEAIVNGLTKEHVGIFNLKTSNYQIRELGEEVARITGCGIEIVEQKFEDQRNYHVDSTKADISGLLDFEEILDVPFGVRQVLDLCVNGRVKHTDDSLYSNEKHILGLVEKENSQEKPKLIDGGVAVDDRGQLIFNNEFNFNDVKRFYVVENFSLDTVRAFHGHLKEAKYAFVVSGSALVATVQMDDTQTPSKDKEVNRYVLSARNPKILYIPAGYANGFKSLEENTKIIFFSTSSLEDSQGDDYRFPYDYWGEDIWKIENR